MSLNGKGWTIFKYVATAIVSALTAILGMQ